MHKRTQAFKNEYGTYESMLGLGPVAKSCDTSLVTATHIQRSPYNGILVYHLCISRSGTFELGFLPL